MFSVDKYYRYEAISEIENEYFFRFRQKKFKPNSLEI